MGYVGSAPVVGDYRKLDDISSSFNGSTTDFTLQVGSANVTPLRETTMIISVGGLIQEPVTAYTVSGSTISFTSAPATGADFFGVLLGDTMSIGTPSDGTITAAKLATTVITGLTASTTIADADLVLVDDGANGTLRKMTRADFMSFGISNTNAVKIDAADVADNEYARFTANGLESRTAAEVAADIEGSIDAVGTLAAGAISSGFGNIDIGSSTFDTTGAVSTGALTTTGALEQSGGAVAFNQGSGDYDFKIESDNTDNIFHVDGGVNAGKGSVTLGYSANPDPNNRAFFKVYPPAITTATDKSTSWVGIQPDYLMTMSGTVPVAASLAVEEPNISGTPTLASTLYIKDAPTEGSTNAAIYVESGDIVTNGNVTINSTPTDETVSGITATFTAGEALERGEVVYFKQADSKMWKAVATASATSRCVAMAAEDISADASGLFLLQGFCTDNGTFPAYTVGGAIYTPEAETASQNVPEQTAPDSDGDFVQVLGWAVTANTLYFNPSNDIIEHA